MAPGTPTAASTDWAGAALAALSVNYLGVYPGNKDTAFQAAAAADPAYRAAFRAFSGYTHLKGTANAWVVRDAMSEYGRFGQIDAVKSQIVPDLGALLPTTQTNFGKMSAPWFSLASWLNVYNQCATYNVCKDQIEKQIFTHTYKYDNGAIEVRTALDQATVDQLYYASKQVKSQFFRVLGTDKPLAGDTNSTLHIHLYASRSDYEVYQPFLTGYSTSNGGMYIEEGATFYTYQRRVPQDSSLTLKSSSGTSTRTTSTAAGRCPGRSGRAPGTPATAPPPWTRGPPSSSTAAPGTTASPCASRWSRASSTTRRAAARA